MRLQWMLIIGFLLSTVLLRAQGKPPLPTEPTTFVKEIERLLVATNREDCKEAAKSFVKLYESLLISEGQIASIRELCEAINQRGLYAHPYYYGVILNASTLLSDGNRAPETENWAQVSLRFLNDLPRSKQARFADMQTFFDILFTRNSFNYSTGGHRWYPTSKSFQLLYQDTTLQVRFATTDIVGVRGKDSILIQEAQGTFYPLTGKWVGNRGKVDLNLRGIKEQAYITFNRYSFEAKQLEYTVDSAILFYPNLLPAPKMGVFNDKIEVINAGYPPTYPRFESYDRVLKIDNMGQDIGYSGGCRLQGAKIIGFGDGEVKATIRIFNKDKRLAVKCEAVNFDVKKGELIVAEDASTSVYFGNDSIYHPKVGFRYDIAKRTLRLTQGENGAGKTPFLNSLQKVEIYVQSLEWQIDQGKIQVGENRTYGDRVVVFESLDYFSSSRYVGLQGISDRNPLAVLKVWSDKNSGVRTLTTEEFAKIFGKGVTQIGRLLNDLAEQGFIFNDSDKKLVTLRDKIFHYNDASIKKKDFDNISIVSDVQTNTGTFSSMSVDSATANKRMAYNALLDMDKNSININGVKSIVISDSQAVAFLPRGNQMELLPNRNINFSGNVGAGYCLFESKGNHFNYERFDLKMDTVNWLEINIPRRLRSESPNDPNKQVISALPEPPDLKGKYKIEPLATRLEQMKGEMEIDRPDNKSGKLPIAQYPIYRSLSSAYAYYDDPQIQNGAYPKSTFFFELQPFELNTIDRLQSESLAFPGRMVSAGIFPDFNETLKVQYNDLSLGFVTKTPASGYPAYGGKGQYTNEITLSNKGLTGKGRLDYLVSSTNSEDIIFMPKQLLASAREFKIDERRTDAIQFPQVFGQNVKLNWLPLKDSMYVQSESKAFEVFKSGYNLEGLVVLTPGGLYGNGLLDWEEASLGSRLMLFGANSIQADSADLSIKAISDKNDIVFKTRDVNAQIDFDKKMGDFKSNTRMENTELPFNSYRTAMDIFNWDMKAQKISMLTNNVKGASFTASSPKAEELTFNGKSADYDLKTNQLRISGVSEIQVADAIITPDKNEVEIGEGGEMKTLKNANILASFINQYHNISRAEVSIRGRNDYRASGYYQYPVGDINQEILFNNIEVKNIDGAKFTTGSGEIDAGRDFLIDKTINFSGTINLSANSKNLSFDGFAKMKLPSIPDLEWFSIDAPVDRKRVVLPYSTPTNQQGERLYVGFFLQRDSIVKTYPLLLQPKYNGTDRAFYETKGFMTYNEAKKIFLFGDSLNVYNPDRIRGNLLSYNDFTKAMIAEGKFNFGVLYDEMKFDCAGDITYIMGEPKFEYNFASGVKFYMPEKLLDIIAADIKGLEISTPTIDYTKDKKLRRKMAEYIADDAKLDKLVEDAKLIDELPLPKEMDYSIFFPRLTMIWNEETGTLTNGNGPVGISSINNKSINKMLDVLIEVDLYTSDGEVFNLYIRTPSDNWYFFYFQRGVLQTYSSNDVYMKALTGMKKSDLKIKVPGGGACETQIADPKIVDVFLSRML